MEKSVFCHFECLTWKSVYVMYVNVCTCKLCICLSVCMQVCVCAQTCVYIYSHVCICLQSLLLSGLRGLFIKTVYLVWFIILQPCKHTSVLLLLISYSKIEDLSVCQKKKKRVFDFNVKYKPWIIPELPLCLKWVLFCCVGRMFCFQTSCNPNIFWEISLPRGIFLLHHKKPRGMN